MFEQHALRLKPGDLVLLYTDGVTDAIDAQLQDFGMERLQRLVYEHQHASAADIVVTLARAINDFAGWIAPFDDVAMVAIKRLKLG
jgi:sigma-B regulation protein RsbU (phosphoserine phosphatase)